MEDELTVLAKSILYEVKHHLKNNYQILESDKEKATDEEILKIIYSTIMLLQSKETSCIPIDLMKSENTPIINKILSKLMEYYMAIYNDNLDLLYQLLDNNFYFGSFPSKDNLFVLDKNLSSNFEQDEYVRLVIKNKDVFKNFYNLYQYHIIKKDEPKNNLDKIMQRFCSIMHKNSDIAACKYCIDHKADHLLTFNLLNLLSEDEILNLNEEEKYMLDDFTDKKDGLTQAKLDLVLKHKVYKKMIYLYFERFYKYFSIDELKELSIDDTIMYSEAFITRRHPLYYRLFCHDNCNLEAKAVNKIKNIKKINKEYNFKLDNIIYDALSEDEILSLSEEDLESLSLYCHLFLNDILENECHLRKRNIKNPIRRKYNELKSPLKKLIKKKARIY